MNSNQAAKIEAAKRDRAMAADYIGGMTGAELADKYGLKRGYVYKRLSMRRISLTARERRNRFVATLEGRSNMGRTPVWPECPPELHDEYMRLRKSKKIAAVDARRILEAA